MWLYKVVYVFIFASATSNGIVYKGCYRDNITARILPHALALAWKTNTPEECAQRCCDYRYVGVQLWRECYCGNTLNETAVSESDCTLVCPGDKSKICGGNSRLSIYTNWACGPPPAIANGKATLRKGTNITYGSIADVYCDTGFINKTTIACLSNTSWEKATCEQPGTDTVSTARTITTNSSTHEGFTTGWYTSERPSPYGSSSYYTTTGVTNNPSIHQDISPTFTQLHSSTVRCIGVQNGTNTDTNDNTTAGSLTLAIRSYQDTGAKYNYCVKSVEGTVEHYNTADKPNEGNCDTDHYYSTEVTEEPYELIKEGNNEYDYTTNTLLSESDNRKPDTIYNKLGRYRPGEYDHEGRLEHNMPRPGHDYDKTDFARRIDGVGDYNHIVIRGNGTHDREHGGYDVLHGITIQLPPCDATDYALSEM